LSESRPGTQEGSAAILGERETQNPTMTSVLGGGGGTENVLLKKKTKKELCSGGCTGGEDFQGKGVNEPMTSATTSKTAEEKR